MSTSTPDDNWTFEPAAMMNPAGNSVHRHMQVRRHAMALTSSVSGQRVPAARDRWYGPQCQQRHQALGNRSQLDVDAMDGETEATEHVQKSVGWLKLLRGAAVPAASLRRLDAGSSLSLCFACPYLPATCQSP